MLFTRFREAIILVRASNLAQSGHVRKALGVLDRLPEPSYNKAVVEALRAYLQILNGKRDQARASIERSRQHNPMETQSALFTDTYCDYLEAMLDGRVADWNHLALELARFPGSPRSRSFLVVDRPMPLQ